MDGWRYVGREGRTNGGISSECVGESWAGREGWKKIDDNGPGWRYTHDRVLLACMHCVQNLTSCAPRKSLGAPLCVWLKVRGEGGLFPNSSAFLLSKFACVDGLSDMMMIALAPHTRTRTKSVPLSPSPHSTKPLLAVLRTRRCRGSPSGCAANECAPLRFSPR